MRTPAKVPVHKTLDECREMVFARVLEVHEEYAAKGWLPARLNLNAGIVRGVLEIFAWILWAFYEFLRVALQNAFPLSAEGDWLKVHAEQLDLPWREATKAKGNVVFTRSEDGGSGNIRIPGGRIVRTKPDGLGRVHRYITTSEAVLLGGESTVTVPVEAEDYGNAGNATAGQICEISTHIPGIGSVANYANWLINEGADRESNEQMQERYVLAWLELAGCTSAAYKSWALNVPGVQSVAVLDQHPRGEGTVDVIVRGTAGIPTESLLEKVRAVISEKAPVNDLWEVKAPQEVFVPIECVLEVDSGNAETAVELADGRIRALFVGSGVRLADVKPFGIGEDFTRDRVVATIVNQVPGVKLISWVSPGADWIVVPADGLAVLQSLNITAREVEA